jgi:hypothetical protein
MKKILVLLISVILLTGCSLKDKVKGKVANKVQEKAQSYTVKSLKAAVKLGVPLKCAYKVNDLEYEGYLQGKKWRGIMRNMEKTTNVIIKENCMYSWTNEDSNGAKMCFDEDVWESEEGQFEQPNMEYVCTPAVFDEGKFSPPSTVSFMDLNDINSMMQQVPMEMPNQEMMELEE